MSRMRVSPYAVLLQRPWPHSPGLQLTRAAVRIGGCSFVHSSRLTAAEAHNERDGAQEHHAGARKPTFETLRCRSLSDRALHLLRPISFGPARPQRGS
eukprot:4694249-Pyramimonas_sp.AAC.1